jgi:integrase
MEKIDIHNSQEAYIRCLAVMKAQLPKDNSVLIEKYLEDSAIGKTQRQRKQAGLRVRIRNLYLLKTCANYFKKPLNKLTEKDMEVFVKALNENKIKKQNGKNYSEQVKSNLKIVLISFLRWAMNGSPEFHKLTDWISTQFKQKEIVELTEEEIKTILKKCITPKQKVLIALLFDSGARIEEFLNIRLADIIEVKGDVPYYKVRLREEFSKTQGRTISLLWRETTPILREWLEVCPNKDDQNKTLFDSTYDGVRMLLDKLGKRSIKKHVNAHLFRHSSATYYASKGFDYFQLCKRYGWSIGSDVPHRYIHKAGIKETEIVDKFKRENLEELQNEVDKLKQINNQKSEEIKELKTDMLETIKRIDKLIKVSKN